MLLRYAESKGMRASVRIVPPTVGGPGRDAMRFRWRPGKRRLGGWLLTAIGFILSPLSWWNDLLVNIPLAYLLAWPLGRISEKLFIPALVIGYWITNVAGFMLMHIGFKRSLTVSGQKDFRKTFWRNFWIACLYTGLIIWLAHQGWISLPDKDSFL